MRSDLSQIPAPVFESSPAMLQCVGPSGAVEWVSVGWLSGLGLRRSDVQGRRWEEMLSERSAHRYARDLRSLRDGSPLVDVPYEVIGAGGRLHRLELSATAVVEASGLWVSYSARHVERDPRASGETLDQFTYAASHDLKEPLRMVHAYIQILGEKLAPVLDEQSLRHMSYVREGAERMRSLIDDLLELARAERAVIRAEPVDMLALVDDIRADLALLIAEHDAQIEVSGTTSSLPRSDPRLLRQALMNLIKNAILFRSAQTPRIEVRLSSDADGWAV
ncbi:MAG: histidine kinase dimerization/phospho-acceptor domain-containing protein, partial [Myxococcota bacterium]